MDERLKSIVDNLDEITVGLDDTFQFHCNMCGKCCINREDILLNPKDIYNLAKELHITTRDFFTTYCETYIGDDSRFPIVRIQPRGAVKRCPLLKDRKCSVHKAKPTVCAMFPLGRCIRMDKNSLGDITTQDVRYILDPPDCGDKSETHTVREWLQSFNLPLEDEFFVAWNRCLMKLSPQFKKLEKMRVNMNPIWQGSMVLLYLLYDTEQDFMPQFESHVDKAMEMLDTLVKEVQNGN